jgi:hypothetical protein
MTREEADDAFDCLSRHARAIAPPNGPADALKLVEKAALAQLQRDAIVHYISVGPAVVNLAYRVLKAGTATFVAAGFAAADGVDPRQLFAARLIALDDALGPAGPAARAGGLLDALSRDLDGGRALLGDEPDGERDGVGEREDVGGRDGVGDLLEAAGIAYVLAQLLENPPAKAA